MRRRLQITALALLLAGARCGRFAPSDSRVTFDPQLVDTEPGALEQTFDGPPSKIFLGSGWYSMESIEKTGPWSGFSWAAGAATVYFGRPPFPEPELVVRCAPFAWKGSPPQTMTPVLNGAELPTVPVPPGFNELRAALPEKDLRPMNTLELRFAYEDVPADRIKSQDTRHIAAVFDDLAVVSRGRSIPVPSSSVSPKSTQARVALGPEGVAIPLPAGTRYRARFGAVVPAGSSLPVAVRIRRSTATGPPLWSGPASVLSGRSVEFEVAGGDPALLLIEPEPSPGVPAAGAAPPAVSVDLFAPEVSRVAGPPPPDGRPDIFVYFIDTLRADAVGGHQSGLPLTPSMDAFARDAVTYENAWSTSSWTLPATVSLLSGVYPFEHGVEQMGLPVPARELPWLPEELSRLGYETVAISQWLLGQMEGIWRGFDRHYLDVRVAAASYAKSPSEVARGLFWQDLFHRPDPKRPLFCFLHVVDPHAIYEPRGVDRVFADRQPGTLPADLYVPQIFMARGLGKNPADLAHLRALYDGEVLHADREFGAFLDLLRYRGLYDRSLIVLLSDHGEEFDEHGGFGHGRTLYEELLRAPLIVKYPEERGAGARIATRVSTLDVMPTVLHALGQPFGKLRLHGRALPQSPSEPAGARALLAELRVDQSGREGPMDLTAVVEGNIKCVHNARRQDRFGRTAPETEAFDLAADPGERSPLSVEDPRVAPCRTELSRWLELAKEASRRPGRPEPKLSPEEIRRLRALGYLN
ncbi:MAG: sulfatase-like hydrolase/transferase [Thermoanaerobaculia bacterium]